ncbi:MAG TPA: hypothetical protein DD490_18920 [Acidobacteria bacterium]|nr:hypothetical protein [Acidobacteriota bacterium]
MAEALVVKRNPVILREIAAGEARGEARAEARGRAKSILQILETRGVAVSSVQRDEILACVDADRLDRWLKQALVAAATEELLG